MNEKLLAILLSWRAELQRRRLPPPPEQDIRRIATSSRKWPPDGLDDVTEAWKPTIQYLEKQQQFGVVDPVAHMAEDMWNLPAGLRTMRSESRAPVTQSAPRRIPAETASAPAGDSVLESLRTWLERARVDSPNLLGNNTDTRLKSIAASTQDNRRKLLSSLGLASHEQEISRAIDGATGSSRISSPATPIPIADVPPSKGRALRPDPTIMGDRPAGAPSRSPSRQTEPLLDVDPDGFAGFDFTTVGGEPASLRVALTAGKNVLASWQPPDNPAPVTIYRVVAGDDMEPYSPESGRLIATTTGLDAEDQEPFASAVRHLQVWCNSGSSIRAAKTTQPTLLAKKIVVCPVQDFVLREEAGSVTGEWEVFPGVQRVQVFRVPIEKAQQGALSPLYSIQAGEDNLGGFKDDDAERGRRYLYQAVAEATVEGVTISSTPVSHEQLVSVVLQRVVDLDVSLSGDETDAHFDIVWTPPAAGRVVVYRGQRRPRAGIEDEELDITALALANLSDEQRLGPIKREIVPGRDGMRRVPWPQGWSRAYFTPVTTLNGRALVGKTVSATRVPEVRDAILRERVNEQLLTFSWPVGAAAVWVHSGLRNSDASLIDVTRTRPEYEISHEMWVAHGGWHFAPPLPLDGCALHLYSVAFQHGETFRSRPITVDYAGLRIIRYMTTMNRNRRTGRLTSIDLTILSDTPSRTPAIKFALVLNRDRFPLHIKDGLPLPIAVAGIEGATTSRVITPSWAEASPVQVGWCVDMTEIQINTGGTPYFIRLFADLPPERLAQVAVIDPPIDNLRLV